MSIFSIRQAVVAVVLTMAAGAIASPTLEARVCCGSQANCPPQCHRVSDFSPATDDRDINQYN